jgi:hypothetical protein
MLLYHMQCQSNRHRRIEGVSARKEDLKTRLAGKVVR